MNCRKVIYQSQHNNGISFTGGSGTKQGNGSGFRWDNMAGTDLINTFTHRGVFLSVRRTKKLWLLIYILYIFLRISSLLHFPT